MRDLIKQKINQRRKKVFKGKPKKYLTLGMD